MDAQEFDKEPKKPDAYRRMDAEVKDTGKASGTKKSHGYRRMGAKEFEGMKRKAKVGFKGDTNEHVISVKKVDASSFKSKSTAGAWLRKNKWSAASTGIGVALDAKDLVVSIIEDGGSFGPSTTITVSEIAGEVVGSYSAVAIATKIASLFSATLPTLAIPGVNIAVSVAGIIGFIGGLIGSLLAGGIARFFLGLNPTAPGTGPPILDTDPQPFVYGPPDTGHNTGATGAPGLGTNTGASGAPSLGFNTGAIGHPDPNWASRH